MLTPPLNCLYISSCTVLLVDVEMISFNQAKLCLRVPCYDRWMARGVRQDAACLGAPSLRIIRTFGLKAPMFTFKLCFFFGKIFTRGIVCGSYAEIHFDFELKLAESKSEPTFELPRWIAILEPMMTT